MESVLAVSLAMVSLTLCGSRGETTVTTFDCMI